MAMQALKAIIFDELTDNFDIDNRFYSFVIQSCTATGAAAAACFPADAPEPVRVPEYVEGVVKWYYEIEFKSHFRMRRSTFEVY